MVAYHNKKEFDSALPAAFDGEFYWDWIEDVMGTPKMKFSDIDASFERNDCHLMFETKKQGVEIPLGQRLRNESLIRLGKGRITFVNLEGKKKEDVKGMEVWNYNESVPGKIEKKHYKCDAESVAASAADWYEWADSQEKLPR